MKLVYDIHDKPPIRKNLVYAFQQVLAIMAATLLVPVLVNSGSGTEYMSQPAALCGAGFGTLFYLLMTQFKSPVFLGSSFAFIAPLIGATAFGFMGIFLGAVFAGLVYVLIAVIIKATGSGWVNKLLPPVVIGPTVALIGLSLCGSAVNNLTNTASSADGYSLVHILVGLLAFFITVFASVKGSKGMKLVPFIIGILGSYAIALALTFIGKSSGNEALQIINLSAFDGMKVFEVPEFTFLGMFEEGASKISGIGDVFNVFMLFAPVAFVNSIPSCIVGGVCIALYGFIAVSGLKMLQPVDLNDNRNLFVVAAILVCGIGGLELRFGPITISAIATALIVGILVNVLFNRRAAKEKAE